MIESASEQPAERFGRSTRLFGARILADSAMKWTPQKRIVDCGTCFPMIASPSESPTWSAIFWTSGTW